MKLSEKIRKGSGFYIAHSPNSWADHAEALEAVAEAVDEYAHSGPGGDLWIDVMNKLDAWKELRDD